MFRHLPPFICKKKSSLQPVIFSTSVYIYHSLYMYLVPRASLYDVAIEGEDGHVVHCHKCIAVARLEYFHSMMARGWIEVKTCMLCGKKLNLQ